MAIASAKVIADVITNQDPSQDAQDVKKAEIQNGGASKVTNQKNEKKDTEVNPDNGEVPITPELMKIRKEDKVGILNTKNYDKIYTLLKVIVVTLMSIYFLFKEEIQRARCSKIYAYILLPFVVLLFVYSILIYKDGNKKNG